MNEVKPNTPKLSNTKITTRVRPKVTSKKPLSKEKIEEINKQITTLMHELKDANTAFEADPNNATIEATRLNLQMQIDSLRAQINTNGLF